MFRTLLVEDSRHFRNTLQEILHQQFPQLDVTEADDGQSALRSIADSRPDLVFMDIKLPDENGLELAYRIKTFDPSIVVIILTSHDIPEYRQAAFRNGASCFMSKESVQPEDIIALIQGAMSYGIWY